MNFEISFDLPPYLSSKDWVAIDLELFNAEKTRLHRPTTGTFACLSICYRPDIVHVITDEKLVKDALYNIQDAVWIFHNAMFDITHLRRWAAIYPRKKLWDTMIVERIMGGGLYDTFSLEDVARRRLNLLMEKEVRKTFESANQLTEDQIHYAAKDAAIDWLICEHQKKEITKNDYKIWTDVDRKAFWAMLDFIPFRLDVDAWRNLAKLNEAKASEIKAQLDFNPASPKQVLEVLSKAGFKMLKNTQEATLEKAIEKYKNTKACELAKLILEYRKYAKRASTYGENFLRDYLEDIGDECYAIRSGYWVIGAETGRTASDRPNFQNIPVRDTKDFRKCFIPRKGNKLVIADMGQQETRIAAYLSQDKNLMKILENKDQDIFVGMAKMIYKMDITKDDPFRKLVKNTVYGILYGMSAEGMADRYGISKNDAEDAINQFFRTFPNMQEYLIQQERKVEYVETVAGRKIWLNPYSEQVTRNARNSPIQGTAADQMKVALGNIHEKWRVEVPEEYFFACVGYVHDELIFDVQEQVADKVAKFVAKEMVDAAEEMCPGISFVAEPKIADTWADKE